MLLANKKAAGAENLFTHQDRTPQVRTQKVIKRSYKPSPVYKTVVGILLISCIFFTALAFTFIKARTACLNWELSQIKQENAVLAENIEKTKLEIASQKSLSRIKSIAVNDLGMIERPQITYLVMNDVFTEKVGNEQSTENNQQDVPQLASAEKNGKSSIFKAFCEVLALQEIIGKG